MSREPWAMITVFRHKNSISKSGAEHKLRTRRSLSFQSMTDIEFLCGDDHLLYRTHFCGRIK